MLYLSIDQHRKQLTVCVHNEAGDVILQRQVSTRWAAVRAFFAELEQASRAEGGYVAILEVCGFNAWLIQLLKEHGCRQLFLVQPHERSRQKTDRRDARQLGELLWVNRQRLLSGQRVPGLRWVQPATPQDEAARQLTALRQRAGARRTRTLNAIQHLLLKYNLQQECPTKGLQTKRARGWLGELQLPPIDRLEMNHLLDQWQLCERQVHELDEEIARRQREHQPAAILATIPGAAAFTSLALASRVGDLERFKRPASLANYWGLAPGCRNSGDAKCRLGSITKEGSAIARFVLGQLVLHVLRRDGVMRGWYKRIKQRRGSKIARVAVMRRLTCIIWHMLKHQQAYRCGWPAAWDETDPVAARRLPARPRLGLDRRGPPLPPSPSLGPSHRVQAEATVKAEGAHAATR